MDEGASLCCNHRRLLNHLIAQATLARLHAHGDVADPFVVSQMDDIKASLELSKDEASWKELFVVPSNFRRLALGYILQFSVQMTGVSAIQYYSTTIFVTMGFTSSRILLFQSINSVIALIGEVGVLHHFHHTVTEGHGSGLLCNLY